MPASLGAAIVSAAYAVAGSTAAAAAATSATVIVGSVTVAGAVGTIALGALEFGLTSLISGPGQKSAAQQFTVRQPVPSRRRYYGKDKAGGVHAFLRSNGNGSLFDLVLVATHEVEFLEHWIGDRRVTLAGGGDVIAPPSMTRDYWGSGVFAIDVQTGLDDQLANARLISNFPVLWTTAHRLQGIANILLVQRSVKQTDFTKYYPGGAQPYRGVIHGDRVWNGTDPEQNIDDRSTWNLGYDNAAWVIFDYLTHKDGMRLPRAAVLPSLAKWQYAATVSDQSVPLLAGGTDRRYRIDGGYDLPTAPKDVLKAFSDSCDGWLAMQADGSIALEVGEWQAPSVTITQDHIRSFSLPKGLGPLRTANEIRATFTDPNNDYQPVEALPWRDEADISARGTVIDRQIDLTYCPSHNQARRMMKIAASRANPERAGTITTDLFGLNALGERRIHVTIKRRGRPTIDLDMDVTSFKIDMATQSCIIGVSAADSAVYEFDAATEEGVIPAPNPGSTGGDIEVPTGVMVTSTDGTLTASCDVPTDRQDLQFHAEYTIHSGSVWTIIPVAIGAYTGTSGSLPKNSYDVRVWFTTQDGAASEYVEVDGVDVGGVAAPSSPTGITAINASGTVTVDFFAPNDPNVSDCRVYRGSGAFGSAVDISGPIYCAPNQKLEKTDTPGAGTWNYWATAESVSGNASAPDGPAVVTV
jgi:hypothetical protein